MCDRHPPFDVFAGDRAIPLSDNIARTVTRATKIARSRNQRQVVTVHTNAAGYRTRFYIQNADRVAVWRAEQAAADDDVRLAFGA